MKQETIHRIEKKFQHHECEKLTTQHLKVAFHLEQNGYLLINTTNGKVLVKSVRSCPCCAKDLPVYNSMHYLEKGDKVKRTWDGNIMTFVEYSTTGIGNMHVEENCMLQHYPDFEKVEETVCQP